MEIIWTGAVGDNIFDSPGNWSPAQVPGAGDDVTIAAAVTITVNGDVTVNSLTTGADTVLDVTSGFGILGVATTADPSGTSTIDGTVNVNDGESFNLAGTIAGTGTIALTSHNDLTDLVASGAQPTLLTGGGSVVLSDNPANLITGVSASTVLDNVSDTISGAGQLGYNNLTLVNGGMIDATGENSLTLNATAVTNTGTLQATGEGGLIVTTDVANSGGVVAANGGNVYLEGGTIAGGTLASSGGASIQVSGFGTFDGTASPVDTTGVVQVDNDSTLNLLGSIDNTGTIDVNSTNQTTALVIDSGTVTLTGGGSVVLSDNPANFLYGESASDTLDNVDNTLSGAGIIGDEQLTLINAGIIDATDANSSLTIDTSAATNSGTIEATGAGGLVISSAIANADGIVDANGGNVYLDGGTIAGGTLESSGGASIDVSSSGILDGSASAIDNAGVVQVDNESTLHLLGSIDNTGTIDVNSTNQTTALVIDSSTVTLSGGGSVVLSDNPANYLYGESASYTLDNVDNTISGAGELGYNNLILVNGGMIDATGENSLTLNATAVTNTGTLQATGEGGLIVTTDVANSGGVVAANGGDVFLDGGTIAGGTLESSGDASIDVSSSGTLDGSASAIDNTGAVQVNNESTLDLLGSIDNTGTIDVNSTNQTTALVIDSGTVTLSGGGSVVLSDNPANFLYGESAAYRLDNVDNTISGAGQLGYNNLILVNGGMIDATGENSLTLNATAVTNTGTLQATGEGGLIVTTDVANSGGVVAANGGNVFLDGGTIAGGTLESSGGASIDVSSSGTLDGSASAIDNTGAVQVNNESTLDLLGSIDNTGTIDVDSSNQTTALVIDSSTVTLSGGGSVLLSDNANNYVYGASSSDTLDNVDNTISGSGDVGAGQLILINGGVIDATGSGAALELAATSVTNTGTIEATGSAGLLIAGGTLTNTGIIAANGGDLVMDSTAALSNNVDGTLTGGTYEAIGAILALGATPIVTDAATVVLSGADSVLETIGGATLETSLQSISGSGELELLDGRSFSSQTAGSVLSNAGAIVLGGSTLTAALDNSGTVSGSGGVAGSLVNSGLITATGGALTVAESGVGNFAVASTGILDLTDGATGGAVKFLGSGAELELDAPGSFGDSLASLAGGDEIAIRGDVTSAVIRGTSELSFVVGGKTFDYQLTGAATGLSTHLVASGVYTDIEVETACYLRGTRILTDRGEVAIECLKVGDLVVTAPGQPRPVRWLGHRDIDCDRYPDPCVVWPVCIKAGAFAEGLPRRDLWVSPGHSMLVDGVLIQAEKLINDATILRVPRAQIEYWHVELDSHDIVFAEGLPSETYLDTGNRTAFLNGGAFLEAYPDFQPRHWADTCVPLALSGPAVQYAKAALLSRAHALGYGLTADADMHVLVDGTRIDPLRLSETRLAFLLPAGSSIDLRSRSFIPAHVRSGSDDLRRLGVCIGRLQIDGTDVSLDDEAAFTQGWHALETPAQGGRWRWSTDRLPLPAGTRLVVLDIAGPGCYWTEPATHSLALVG